MDVRTVVRRRIAGRLPAERLGAALCVAGAVAVALSWDGDNRIAAVGLLYAVLGGGLAVLSRSSDGRPAFRRVLALAAAAAVLAFALLFADTLRTRAIYSPTTADLLAGSAGVAVRKLLDVGPVALFALLGFAERRGERAVAVPALVVTVAFAFGVALLSGYRGFGWPVLPLLLSAVTLLLAGVAGAPLYVLGVLAGTDPRFVSRGGDR